MSQPRAGKKEDSKMDIPLVTKKKRSKKVRMIIVLSVIVVLAIGGVCGLLYVKSKNAAQNTTSTVKYANFTVAKGNVDVTVQESGSIAAGQADSVKADQDITIATFSAQVGDAVAAGDPVASIDTSSLQTTIDTLQSSVDSLDKQLASANTSAGSTSLTSPVEGRVKLLHAVAGTPVQKTMDDYGYLCVISSDGHMNVTFAPADGTVAAVGDAVTITFADGTTETTVISSETSDGQFVAVIAEDTYDAGAPVTITNASGLQVGSGELQVNAPIPVTLAAGTVSALSAAENDYVYKGSTLLTLTEGQLSDSVTSLISQRETAWNSLQAARTLMANPMITAQEAGVVSAVSNSNMIKANGEIYQIVPASSFNMTISVDELNISKIKKGQTAVITIDALSDLSINGTVTRISNIGTSTNGVTTYPVTVTLDKTDGLMAGMSSSCTIAIDSAKDVLYVPVGAVQTIANKKYVLVSNKSAAVPTQSASSGTPNFSRYSQLSSSAAGTLVEVQLGLVNDTNAEITSGLTEGQTVLVPTFTSTSTTSSNTSGFPGGGMMGDLTGGGNWQGTRTGTRDTAAAANQG